jgi:hypothetical protein
MLGLIGDYKLDLARIVSELKSERDRISRAIALLENEATRTTRSVATPIKMAPSKKRRRGLTPAGRKRLSEAMKKRWADRKKKIS